LRISHIHLRSKGMCYSYVMFSPHLCVQGPVACTINADPLRDYEGGIIDDEEASTSTNHIVSIVGFGKDDETGKDYWIIRNSWGEYWGEMGFAKVAAGKNMLGMEANVAWVTPGTYTVENVPCSEDGTVCGGEAQTHSGKSVRTFVGEEYVDPSVKFLAKKVRVRQTTFIIRDSFKIYYSHHIYSVITLLSLGCCCQCQVGGSYCLMSSIIEWFSLAMLSFCR